MRHQRLEINHTGSDQRNRLRVDIMVPVLELEVDFLGGHVHERDVLEVFSDSDHEHGASEAGCLYQSVNHLSPKTQIYVD